MAETFKIGDKVWVAHTRQIPKYITCPDCFGKKYLTVILGDDSRVTIECSGCSKGFNPARGVIETFEMEPTTEEKVITGLEQRTEKGVIRVTYRFDCYGYDDDRVHRTKEEAAVAAESLRQERLAEEKARINRKERETKTWAWNVHYYRQQVKNGLEQVKRYSEMLDAAKPHMKAEKSESK